MITKEIVLSILKDSIQKIEQNKCELSEEDVYQVLKQVAHIPMSKSDAYKYMELSRTAFDYKISKGELPRGQKRKGFNELVWYKDQLDEYKS